ncbi:hypothetical protein V7S43_004239 [Phytophthora oleae]|uniref:Uncharacterized protein n=1 Tax=Phytophthora oleae TaxID=2107226 RepID=A0ABD3FXK8_9STRA
MTMACGCGYLYAVLDVPTLKFHQLKHPLFPSSSFQIRRGFVSVLRWLESLNSREDLLMLGQLLTQARLGVDTANKEVVDFALKVASGASSETILHFCQLGLQWGLIIFLHRRRVLSKNQTIPTLCLCILNLLCWKMAQTCVYEMLAPYRSSTASEPRTQAFALKDSRDEITASFLNALFVARYSSTCVTNLIFGRAYQVYFCDPWPTKWKRVPAYLGSKNLVLSTLFFAAAGVGAMSVSSPALRSLCEAAAHFQSLALTVAFGHFIFVHFQDKDEKLKANAKPADQTD